MNAPSSVQSSSTVPQNANSRWALLPSTWLQSRLHYTRRFAFWQWVATQRSNLPRCGSLSSPLVTASLAVKVCRHSGLHGSTSDVQTHLVPIFETYGVDVVFSGHDHHYERDLPHPQ